MVNLLLSSAGATRRILQKLPFFLLLASLFSFYPASVWAQGRWVEIWTDASSRASVDVSRIERLEEGVYSVWVRVELSKHGPGEAAVFILNDWYDCKEDKLASVAAELFDDRGGRLDSFRKNNPQWEKADVETSGGLVLKAFCKQFHH